MSVKNTPRKKRNGDIATMALTIFITIATIGVLFWGTRNLTYDPPQINNTQELEGNWSTRDGMMTAYIKDGLITVTPSSGAVYWRGTFIEENRVGEKIQSHVPSGVQMTLSTAKQKEFRYVDATLEFDFAVLGQTKTVTLHRD